MTLLYRKFAAVLSLFSNIFYPLPRLILAAYIQIQFKIWGSTRLKADASKNHFVSVSQVSDSQVSDSQVSVMSLLNRPRARP